MSSSIPADAVLEVAAVRTHRHAAPLLRPFVTAARRTEAVEYLAVEVELAGGLHPRPAQPGPAQSGPAHPRPTQPGPAQEGEARAVVGQGTAADTKPVTGEDLASITAAVTGPITAALTGARGTIAELSALLARSVDGASSARAAVDVALHDAWGKAAGRPLMELLGGAVHTRIESDMTVSLEEPDVMAQHAREAAAEGYRVLKIKLGRDVDEDRRRLDAVLDAVPGARLRLDANQGWSVQQAIEIIGAFEADGLPVDLVEQPVAAADLEGMAQVRRAVSTPIMADESVWTAADARRIAELDAADMLNIKLAKTGGIPEAMAIADVARDAGLTCMVGAMMEPSITIAGAAHVALAHPAITMVDLDSPDWLTTRHPSGGYKVQEGWLALTGGPGLGMELLHPDQDPPR